MQVTKNEQAGRYEAHIDGELAGFAEYERSEGVVEFPHTVTEPEFGGRGVASALARTSLDEARAEGLQVIPSCSFYAGWISKHPEYADLVRS
ncbi:N-acetyltransferase [Mobilicoccus caccae]|uniref:N-acetyltransferase n=1 Tax=Mobilicoccus caccae TaxID=1859295 RepID=A0ABQ6INF6_9MICO|nr:N-acetyltransferase [Mobilicoccus caccae]